MWRVGRPPLRLSDQDDALSREEGVHTRQEASLQDAQDDSQTNKNFPVIWESEPDLRVSQLTRTRRSLEIIDVLTMSIPKPKVVPARKYRGPINLHNSVPGAWNTQ
jgi:hypothetical protein